MKKIAENIVMVLIMVVMTAVAIGIIALAWYLKFRFLRWGLGI